MTKPSGGGVMTRRQATTRILAAVGGLAAGCDGTARTNPDAADGGDARRDGQLADGDGGLDALRDGAETGDAAATWASGGTQAMTGLYADPFPTAAAACVLATTATEGPCTEAADQLRKDISEGYTGLPMRLALRVVGPTCAPLAGAKVKVWHTQINGSYSGNTPNTNMCLKDVADAAKHYFRGAATTDTNGRVDFDSCFPGWYRGRTVHIHYTVSLNGRLFTSQLVFDQTLVNEIFSTHPEYKAFGLPDTTNVADNVVGRGGNLEGYTVATSRLPDGAMMAAKLLVVSVV